MLSTEHFGDAKVGKLNEAVRSHEQILKLYVTVCDTMAVKIVDGPQNLLEETEPVFDLVMGFKEALVDQAVHIAHFAIFHHVIPTSRMCAEAECLNDVWMMQGFCNSVLGLDLFDVIRLVFSLFFSTELLDRNQFVLRPFHSHDGDFRSCANSQLLPPTRKHFSRFVLVVEFTKVHMELVRQACA